MARCKRTAMARGFEQQEGLHLQSGWMKALQHVTIDQKAYPSILHVYVPLMQLNPRSHKNTSEV